MTNKEAIDILKNYHNGYFGYKIEDVQKAHNLAIKAIRIVEVIENGFKRDSNLMIDSDDWEDIKEYGEEAENDL